MVLGRENDGRVSGSLRRAVIVAGVLMEIIVLSGGITSLVSIVRAGRTWSGSCVEERRSRREK